MKTTIAVVLAIIIAGAGWYVISSGSFSAPGTPASDTGVTAGMPVPGTQTPDTEVTQTAPTEAVVTYGPNGFSPASVTVPRGGRVVFIASQGTDKMWVASAPHPTHEGYDGTTKAKHCAAGYTGPKPFDQCAVGTDYVFTFDKAGTWKYHNHSNSSQFGTVIVQ